MLDDPRQARTRQALTEALLRLLRSDGLSGISVAALCAEARVHRTTFYGHASGIEEFAVDLITREVDKLAAVEPGGPDPLRDYREAMVDLLAGVAASRPLYRTLLDSPWAGTLRISLDANMQHRVRIALEVFAAQDGATVPPNREEIVAFVSGGLVGTIVRWAHSDDEDAEGWAQRTQAMMPEWWPVH